MAKNRTQTKKGIANRRARPRAYSGTRRSRRGRETKLWAGVAVAGGLALAVVLLLLPKGQETGTPTAPYVGGDLHSLVVDPADPSRLYVGGHEGVAVSTNEGRTWRPVPTLDGADAMGWAFSGDHVLVSGHPGIHVSSNGGATFRLENEGLPSTDVHALGAGADRLYAASPQVGVLMSADGGSSWEVRTDQVGQGFMGRILVDPADLDHLVAPDMQYGAVESTDGGRTWRSLGGLPGAMWVSWDPGNPDRLVVSAPGTAAKSTDGGRSWQPLTVPGGASIVEMDPSDPDLMYAAGLDGTSASVWVSRDGGATWNRP